MKSKIKIIFYLLILCLIFSIILNYNYNFQIICNDYEVTTNTKFVLILLLFLFLSGFLLANLLNIIFGFNKNKLIHNIKNIECKYNEYLKYINNAYSKLMINNFNDAEKYLNKANKILKNENFNNISKLFFLNYQKKYSDALNLADKNDILINLNINLLKAIDEKNNEKIVEFSKKILNLENNNKICLKLIYNIYKEEKNFNEAKNILIRIEKYKIFNKEQLKLENYFLDFNLCCDYFDRKDYKISFKLSEKLFKNIKYDSKINKILIYSLNELKNKNIDKYIQIIWKFTPCIEFGYMYLNNKKNYLKYSKKLYNINKNNIISIIFYCKNLIYKNKIDLITPEIKSILLQNNYKEVFEILLEIEKSENNSNLIIENLNNKINNSKSINNFYIDKN